MNTVRLTTCQALDRYLCTQRTATGERFIAGFWAIFGRCNVAPLGDALYAARADMPTSRGHNEQAMAHVAIAFSKAHKRRRDMVVTTSIGPGATNMVTAAALAHVNCLPVLLFQRTYLPIDNPIRCCNSSRILPMAQSAQTIVSYRPAAMSTE